LARFCPNPPFFHNLLLICHTLDLCFHPQTAFSASLISRKWGSFLDRFHPHPPFFHNLLLILCHIWIQKQLSLPIWSAKKGITLLIYYPSINGLLCLFNRPKKGSFPSRSREYSFLAKFHPNPPFLIIFCWYVTLEFYVSIHKQPS
jgi:hypothetical protein